MLATTVTSPVRIRFWQHHADGDLTVFPEGHEGVPFAILRVFTIAGVSAGGRRANHAHRRCCQMLACLAGSVTVEIADGRDTRSERLKADGECLLIPPLLWNSVIFESPGTVLAVFCDRLYEEDDYLRDWNEYVRLRQGTVTLSPPSSPAADGMICWNARSRASSAPKPHLSLPLSS